MNGSSKRGKKLRDQEIDTLDDFSNWVLAVRDPLSLPNHAMPDFTSEELRDLWEEDMKNEIA